MRRAFTLIELLVAISIIALLIAILLPALSNARESARIIQCGIDQRSLGTASITFATDYKGRLPDFHYVYDRDIFTDSPNSAGGEAVRIFRMSGSWKPVLREYGAIRQNYYSVCNPDYLKEDSMWKPGQESAGATITLGRLSTVGTQGNNFASPWMRSMPDSGFDGTEGKPAFATNMEDNTVFRTIYVDLSRQYPVPTTDNFVDLTNHLVPQGANHIADDGTEATGSHHTDIDGSTTFRGWAEMKARGEEKGARFWW